ncbi:MAG TPA: hypothetical protein VM120_09800 [Bryobacteraceae bacterium]|nr:hypothetical protein [Bryobacteraceae bacterium]
MFCASEAIRTDGWAAEPCEVTFEFHDNRGRILKQATRTLQPDQAAFLDLRASEIGLTLRRGEIVPCIGVARGGAVSNFEMFDTFSGLTLLLANPAALMLP